MIIYKKMALRVGTFNILNISTNYQQRKHLIRQAVEEMQCDLYGFQEVHPLNEEVLSRTGYEYIYNELPQPFTATYDPELNIQGNSMLLSDSLPIISRESLLLINNDRLAQLAVLQLPTNEPLYFINTHLESHQVQGRVD